MNELNLALSPSNQPQTQVFRYQKQIAIWLYTGVAMLLIQVILGGITRLTGSGLSITEWNVVTGALPPLNASDWMIEFDKYRQTPQYLLLNSDFTLADFKFIFFWEWFHRAWARLIAFAFLIPFIYFIVRGAITSRMIKPLIILFLLGALQGVVGWVMVASGLVGDAVYVKPVRLGVHFVLALGLISYAFWFALSVSIPIVRHVRIKRLNTLTWSILLMLFFQLLFGALMAGNKAAIAAPTWPSINGEWVPKRQHQEGLITQLFEDKFTIHFVHRTLAYLLLFLTVLWTVAASRARSEISAFRKWRSLPMTLILIQVALGISALLTSRSIIPNHWGGFDWIALFHQVTGIAFLLSMISMVYLSYAPLTAIRNR